jgi:hypothetical protein
MEVLLLAVSFLALPIVDILSTHVNSIPAMTIKVAAAALSWRKFE